MNILIMGLMSWLGFAGTSGASIEVGTWCLSKKVMSDRERITEFHIEPVTVKELSAAKKLLSHRSIYSLTKSAALRLAPGISGRGPGFYYLVRSSVSLPRGASKQEMMLAVKRNTRYELYRSSLDRSLSMFVTQGVKGVVEGHNMPVVIKVPKELGSAYLTCFTMD